MAYEVKRDEPAVPGPPCPRCPNPSMVWTNANWHCTVCGYGEGCC